MAISGKPWGSQAGTPVGKEARPEVIAESGSWKTTTRREAVVAPKNQGLVRLVASSAPVEPAVLSVTCKAHDDVLQYTHTFVRAYAQSRYRKSLAQSLSVATHELLGNALTYCAISGDVVFQIVEAPNSVAVRVSNPTVQVRLDMMRAHLERLSKSPEGGSPDESGRSAASASAPPMHGLARVVHEAKLALEVYVVGSLVTVVARGAP